MGWSESWQPRLAEVFGAVGPPQRLGRAVWRLRAGGRTVVVKTGAGVGDEADGLRQLAAVAGGPAVPEVLLGQPDLLVTGWVEPAPRTTEHDERLGRQLAGLHRTPADSWGGGSSWIGACRVDPAPRADGAGFYRDRLLDLAGRCRLQAEVAPVAERLEQLVPFAGPACLHGDLWWGNVVRGASGRPWLIDPSVHGGHPEEDLAMLGLFGPVPDRLLNAYLELHPLADGWRQRVALWQLYPLLVHSVLFGGGYRAQATAAARRYAPRRR